MSYHDVGKVKTVESAAATLRGLEGALAALLSLRDRTGTEREQIAYLAMTGEGPAKKRLAALTAQAASIGLEIENTQAALTEARHRLASAEAAAQRAQREADAHQGLEAAAQIREAAQLAGEAATALIVRVERARALIGDAHRLGLAPRDEVIRAYLGRIIAHVLYPVTRQGLLPPSDRNSLEGAIAAYGQSIEREARRILGEHADEEAA
jgi:hypothetical protein